MKIPRYWAYAKNEIRNTGGFRPYADSTVYWRSSEISVDDAQTKANEAAERVRNFLETRHNEDFEFSSYPYDARNIREKLLEEIPDTSGQIQAFLSRNSAGAVVLNVADVMFLDWDTARPTMLESLTWLWNKMMPFPFFKIDNEYHDLEFLTSAPMEPDYVPLVFRNIKELKHIIKFIRDNPNWSVRIYKTAAGYRGLVTHAPFDPKDDEVSKFMDTWYCDPKYKVLCRLQVSFRARLTPKGDRLGLWGIIPRVLPHDFSFKYPWLPEDTAAADLYDNAVQIYEERRKSYATCQYLGTLGSGLIHQQVKPIVELHDRWTIDDDKPLA